MILTFLLSGSYLTMKMDSGGALWSCHLSQGNMYWVGDRVAGVEGESREVSGPGGELDEGEGEGWQGGE